MIVNDCQHFISQNKSGMHAWEGPLCCQMAPTSNSKAQSDDEGADLLRHGGREERGPQFLGVAARQEIGQLQDIVHSLLVAGGEGWRHGHHVATEPRDRHAQLVQTQPL